MVVSNMSPPPAHSKRAPFGPGLVPISFPQVVDLIWQPGGHVTAAKIPGMMSKL